MTRTSLEGALLLAALCLASLTACGGVEGSAQTAGSDTAPTADGLVDADPASDTSSQEGGSGSDDGGAVAADTAGADDAESPADGGLDAGPADPDAQADSGAQPGLTVHACSTFTVFQDSAGVALVGVQHAEEGVPAFVHQRDLGVAGTGAAEVLQQGVSFRLQTPVFFLRATEPTTVTLQASFPAGVLSAHWPKASAEAPPKTAKLALGQGQLTWTGVQVDGAAGPKVTTPSVWQQLQQAQTTGLTLGAETAPFVFYQGLGALDAQVKAVSVPSSNPAKPAVAVTNNTGSPIPYAWYVHVHDGGGMLTTIGAIPDGVTRQGGLTPKELNFDLFSSQTAAHLQARLVDAGLTADEAKAMVGSWAHNYFKTHGRRVLYVAPPGWVATHLPTKVTPEPAQSARVVVGRIELLSKADEDQLVTDVKVAAKTSDTSLVGKLGVFAEPRLRRAHQLLSPGAAKEHCTALIALAAKAK